MKLQNKVKISAKDILPRVLPHQFFLDFSTIKDDTRLYALWHKVKKN